MLCELRSAGVVLLGAPAGRKRAQALTVEGRLNAGSAHIAQSSSCVGRVNSGSGRATETD